MQNDYPRCRMDVTGVTGVQAHFNVLLQGRPPTFNLFCLLSHARVCAESKIMVYPRFLHTNTMCGSWDIYLYYLYMDSHIFVSLFPSPFFLFAFTRFKTCIC